MSRLRDVLCPLLCRYHKPDPFEPPGCAGFSLLAELDRSVELRDLVLSLDPRAEPLFGLSADDPRLLEICARCPYPPDGCDFRNPAVARASCAPCGGLRAVAGLTARGILP